MNLHNLDSRSMVKIGRYSVKEILMYLRMKINQQSMKCSWWIDTPLPMLWSYLRHLHLIFLLSLTLITCYNRLTQ